MERHGAVALDDTANNFCEFLGPIFSGNRPHVGRHLETFSTSTETVFLKKVLSWKIYTEKAIQTLLNVLSMSQTLVLKRNVLS